MPLVPHMSVFATETCQEGWPNFSLHFHLLKNEEFKEHLTIILRVLVNKSQQQIKFQ